MTYASKASAKRAALRQFGKDSKEGADWEITSGKPDTMGNRRWDYIPGSKYDGGLCSAKGSTVRR